ncbi:hypothetical protein HDU67_009599 [Dinochytrium kinnereticum]|nr:hypothetical protein HDU67_009599 [Dinochytrium kinnereticum]
MEGPLWATTSASHRNQSWTFGMMNEEARVLSVSLILAQKYSDDAPYGNRVWGQILGVVPGMLSGLEARLLALIGFNLYVNEAEYISFCRGVQALAREWNRSLTAPSAVKETRAGAFGGLPSPASATPTSQASGTFPFVEPEPHSADSCCTEDESEKARRRVSEDEEDGEKSQTGKEYFEEKRLKRPAVEDDTTYDTGWSVTRLHSVKQRPVAQVAGKYGDYGRYRYQRPQNLNIDTTMGRRESGGVVTYAEQQPQQPSIPSVSFTPSNDSTTTVTLPPMTIPASAPHPFLTVPSAATPTTLSPLPSLNPSTLDAFTATASRAYGMTLTPTIPIAPPNLAFATTSGMPFLEDRNRVHLPLPNGVAADMCGASRGSSPRVHALARVNLPVAEFRELLATRERFGSSSGGRREEGSGW